MKVRVYKNLNRDCLSVQTFVDQKWRVVAYADSVELRDVKFHVSKPGREWVLARGAKTVHAWAEGTLATWVPAAARQPLSTSVWADRLILKQLTPLRARGDWSPPALSTAVTYNPTVCDSFYIRDSNEPITVAPHVVLTRQHGVVAQLAA